MGKKAIKEQKELMKAQKRATPSDSPDFDALSEDTPAPEVPDAAAIVKGKNGLVKKAKKCRMSMKPQLQLLLPSLMVSLLWVIY